MIAGWSAELDHELVEAARKRDRQRPHWRTVIHAVAVRNLPGQPDEPTLTSFPALLPAKTMNGSAQNVEGLVGAVMDMSRSSEARGVKELHQRQRSTRSSCRRLDRRQGPEKPVVNPLLSHSAVAAPAGSTKPGRANPQAACATRVAPANTTTSD
jgi:hypothetical protein